MARFIRPASRAYSASVRLQSRIIVPGMRSSTFGIATELKSPMDANLVRILGNQIQNHIEYAPLYQPSTEIGVFEVTYKPLEQLIQLTGKYGENDNIRIKTSTFDCCVIVPLTGEGPSGGEERHHLSLRIQITKGD